MKFSLKQLQVFLETAHYENITRAADTLSMSQSAASGALKELEQRFDTQFFDRVGKTLQLNEAGRRIRPKVAALIEQAQELESAMADKQDISHLKVGATLTIGNYLAVGLMARFLTEHPAAQASLAVANTATITQQVANFELDVGLVEGELRHPELDVSQWREDELTVFCSPQHPLAGKKLLSDDDLQTASWILREPGSGTRQTFDRAMHGLIPKLNLTLELQHTEGIKRAVEAGIGIGCLSTITLTEAFKRGSLVPLSVPHRDFRRHFYFILHKQKYHSNAVTSWLSLCRSIT